MELLTAGCNYCFPEALAEAIKRFWKEKHNFSVHTLVYQNDKLCKKPLVTSCCPFPWPVLVSGPEHG